MFIHTCTCRHMQTQKDKTHSQKLCLCLELQCNTAPCLWLLSLQHISSRRHRDGVAGKPNPLLSRHKKHRGADLTVTFDSNHKVCLYIISS